VRVIADAQPDQHVQAAGDHAHVLGLWQRADGLDDLGQVHAGPGGHGHVHHDRVAKRRPVDVNPVAADDPGALQPGQPVGDGGGGHLDGTGERPLRLARVAGKGAQQCQVRVVHLDLGRGRSGHLGEPRERS